MVPNVTVRGAKHLPKSISKENLRLAAVKLGSYYGIRAMVIVIKPANHEDNLSDTLLDVGKVPVITIYSPAVSGWASGKKTRTIRKAYATVLAHELAHIRQWNRKAYDELPEELAEKEATALERVYGPIALACLRA